MIEELAWEEKETVRQVTLPFSKTKRFADDSE
jgi:hypothetical protein